MARLPEPVIEEMNATWDEDYPLREKNFYSILGQAIRNRSKAERVEEEGGKTIKSD